MVIWSVVYAKQALKDAKKVKAGGLKEKAQALLEVLESDPFQNPPPFEKLVGDLVIPPISTCPESRTVMQAWAKSKAGCSASAIWATGMN